MPTTDQDNPPKRSNKWIFILAGVVFFFVVSWAIIFIPQYQVSLLRERIEAKQNKDSAQQIQLEKDYVDYGNKARTTLAQIVGGLLFLFTAGAAVWTAIAAQKNAQAAQTNAETAQQNLKLAEKTAQENLEHARDGKITERFSKAVEMLGSEKLEVRLGGIYALERIARDSQPDHWTVMEVLTAFIREKSKKEFQRHHQNLKKFRNLEEAIPVEQILQFEIPTDIQATLTVIGRRNPEWIKQETDSQYLDLSGSVLINANLQEVDMRKANLYNVDLRKAFLYGAKLEHVVLGLADLSAAILEQANFSGADLRDSKGLALIFLNHAIIDEQTKLPPDLQQYRPQLLESSKRHSA